MARDRNVYAWQAYVVVMSIVSLLCFGSLMYVVFQKDTRQKTIEAALEREDQATKSLRKQLEKTQLTMSLLGSGKKLSKKEVDDLRLQIVDDPEIDVAFKQYSNDIALLGPNAKDATYTGLVSTLLQELRARNTQVDSMEKRVNELKTSYDVKLEQETKAREVANTRATDAEKRLEKAQTDYTEKINLQQQTITKIETDKQTLQAKFKEDKNKLTAQISNLRGENDALTKRNGELAERIRLLEGEDFQYAQGEIVEISDGGQSVWINLGKADGLRPGITFGVVNADTTRVADERPKARIEIVAVIQESEHLARAKVLSQRPMPTLLRGDKIFSLAFQPGRKVEFALVGKIDIDGDGTDDRETIRGLIVQNGGIVTCDLKPNSTQEEGALSVSTRWLVIGEEFKAVGGQIDKSNEGSAKRRAELEKAAKGMGIATINVIKLLSWLRGSGSQDVVPLGTAARHSDFVNRDFVAPSKSPVSGLYQNPAGKGTNPPGSKP